LQKFFRFAAFLKLTPFEMNPKILLRMTPLRGARHVWTTYVLPVMMVARTIFLAGNYAMQMGSMTRMDTLLHMYWLIIYVYSSICGICNVWKRSEFIRAGNHFFQLHRHVAKMLVLYLVININYYVKSLTKYTRVGETRDWVDKLRPRGLEVFKNPGILVRGG